MRFLNWIIPNSPEKERLRKDLRKSEEARRITTLSNILQVTQYHALETANAETDEANTQLQLALRLAQKSAHITNRQHQFQLGAAIRDRDYAQGVAEARFSNLIQSLTTGDLSIIAERVGIPDLPLHYQKRVEVLEQDLLNAQQVRFTDAAQLLSKNEHKKVPYITFNTSDHGYERAYGSPRFERAHDSLAASIMTVLDSNPKVIRKINRGQKTTLRIDNSIVRIQPYSLGDDNSALIAAYVIPGRRAKIAGKLREQGENLLTALSQHWEEIQPRKPQPAYAPAR